MEERSQYKKDVGSNPILTTKDFVSSSLLQRTTVLLYINYGNMEGWSRGLRQLFAKQSGIDFASQVRILYFPPIGPIKSIGRWLISSITSGCDKRLVVQIHLGPPRDITLFKIYLHSYYNICCSLNLLKINKLVRMRNFIGMEFLLHTFVLFCHEKYTSFLDK